MYVSYHSIVHAVTIKRFLVVHLKRYSYCVRGRGGGGKGSVYTYHNVSMETEDKPVCQESLSNRLCSPKQQFGVGLGHSAANQLRQ